MFGHQNQSSAKLHVVSGKPPCAGQASETGFTIFIVDDDPSALRTLSELVVDAGHSIQTFSSTRAFLANPNASIPGCVILNLGIHDLSGLQLHQTLSCTHVDRPIIFIAAKSDVQTCVRVMKAGAIDFLTKPVDRGRLLAAIKEAQAAANIRAEVTRMAAKLGTLTPREHQVFAYVVAGRRNKQIAAELGIAEKTVKVYRGGLMMKLGIRTVPDLVRFAERVGVDHHMVPMPAPNINCLVKDNSPMS